MTWLTRVSTPVSSRARNSCDAMTLHECSATGCHSSHQFGKIMQVTAARNNVVFHLRNIHFQTLNNKKKGLQSFCGTVHSYLWQVLSCSFAFPWECLFLKCDNNSLTYNAQVATSRNVCVFSTLCDFLDHSLANQQKLINALTRLPWSPCEIFFCFILTACNLENYFSVFRECYLHLATRVAAHSVIIHI